MKRKLFLFAAMLASVFVSCTPEETESPITHANETITQPTTWLKSEGTHTVTGTTIVENTSLTIEPGTVIKFSEGAKLIVRGQNSSLTALGTASLPIIFTSASNAPTAGDWIGIELNGVLPTTTMTFCTIEFAGGNNSYGAVSISDCSVNMTSCTIRNSNSYGITVSTNTNYDSKFGTFTANNISNCTNAPIRIHPNFAHTIGLANIITTATGIEIPGGTYTQPDETWKLQTVPYVITDDLTIANTSNATLRIEAGSILKLASGVSINVSSSGNYGSLIAQGTELLPITFTSNSTSPQVGDWDYIIFKEGATGCILDHCIVEYGGANSSWGMIDLQKNAQLSVKNSIIRHAKYYNVEAEDQTGFIAFENNTLTKANGHLMKIRAMNINSLGIANVYNTDINSGIYVTGSSSSYNYIEQNATWRAVNTAYFIEDPLIVRNNATLTLEAGATLKFMEGEIMQIGESDSYGKLIAQGTAQLPIIFTSASPAPQAGDWGSIRFSGNTLEGSILSNCKIGYAGSNSSYEGNIIVYYSTANNPVIENCELHNSKYFGLYLKKYSGNLGNPLLSGNTYYANVSGEIGQDD